MKRSIDGYSMSQPTKLMTTKILQRRKCSRWPDDKRLMNIFNGIGKIKIQVQVMGCSL